MRDIATDPNDAAITDAIVALGRHLHLETVAEGVETVEQAEFLRAAGCNTAQGYLYCRPKPADELHRWLAQRTV